MAQRKKTQVALISSVTPIADPLLDIRGLCLFLHLGKTKVFELIHKEGLPYHLFGKAFRFDRVEVRQWLQERRQIA